MKRSEFKVAQMDCPAEESLIRARLAGIAGIHQLEFNLANRKLRVHHSISVAGVEELIQSLNLSSKLLNTKAVSSWNQSDTDNQKRLLWIVLLINLAFFIIEIITGIISGSVGLIADSLDMFADASVYALSLLAVGKSLGRKKKVALIAGYFQIILALGGFLEIIRRVFGGGSLPNPGTMIVVSILALIANVVCLSLLQKSSGKSESHMQASLIFTSNDIIINSSVIVAGVLVYLSQSGIPDLIIGTLVFILVIRGALRILSLSK